MRGYWPTLLFLAALWGASYFFIKVAVADIPPPALMGTRALVAGALLTAYLVATMGKREAVAGLRASWRPAVVLGALNAAIPFWLVAWGETHTASSVAGVAQSTVPLFSFLIGLRFLPHERIAALRWVGLAVGIIGVVVLAGLDPSGGTWAAVGTLAVVLSSASYASGGIFGQLRVSGTPGPVLAAGSMLAGGLMLLPFALLDRPESTPGWKAVASLAALTFLGTVLAQLVFYRGLKHFGARRISLVAYLMPVFALGYGAFLLDEPVAASVVLGLVLILCGVALGAGAVGGRRRTVAQAGEGRA